jgi:hypothetical protein
MADAYRLRVRPNKDENGIPLYDVTKNGKPFLIGKPYSEAIEGVVAVIGDDDTYQEFHGDGATHIQTGKELKDEDRRIRARFRN